MSGNSVKIGDGCATVTGYKLPKPLSGPAERDEREGGSEVKTRSQDTGLAVLVTVEEIVAVTFKLRTQAETCGYKTSSANFSVKEKDEASLSNCFRQDSPNAFILRFAGG